jgi:hypothetical protein
MTTPNTPDFLCCDYSRQAGEQLFATATRADVWLLLEVNRPWGARAFEESDLPQPVKDKLNGYLSNIPNSRVQFIRQLQPGNGIALFVAVARELNPALYQFQLASYEDLLAVDIPAVVAGDAAQQSFLTDKPLLAVCSNARRDRSCGKYGAETYRELLQYGGDAVWQTSHIGGHRFAPTCVSLPYGVVYGRIDPQDRRPIMQAHRHGRIRLENYRGRSCYEPIVQAADYFLREQTGVRNLPGFRLLDVETLPENTSAVRFASLQDERVHRIDVLTELNGVQTYQNTTDAAPTALPQFRLLEHRVIEAQG